MVSGLEHGRHTGERLNDGAVTPTLNSVISEHILGEVGGEFLNQGQGRTLTWIEALAFRPGLGVYGRADRSLRGGCCRASLGFLLFGLFSFAIAALFTLRHGISLLGK